MFPDGATLVVMPELPEVENARTVLAEAVGRTITDVDDRDEWVCRPTGPATSPRR